MCTIATMLARNALKLQPVVPVFQIEVRVKLNCQPFTSISWKNFKVLQLYNIVSGRQFNFTNFITYCYLILNNNGL